MAYEISRDQGVSSFNEEMPLFGLISNVQPEVHGMLQWSL